MFFTKGYELTSVQDIIKAIGVAKGTFYHYFDSKADLLDAVVAQMYTHTIQSLEPLIADTKLPAVMKLERFFGEIVQWKTDNRDLMLDTVRVLYRDENVLLRERLQAQAIQSSVPILSRIIQQGVDEGTFDVLHPTETAQLVLAMSQGMTQVVVALFVENKREPEMIDRLRRYFSVYNQSIERVLGMKANSCHLHRHLCT
jgi:AcrR family transcriptional regulator